MISSNYRNYDVVTTLNAISSLWLRAQLLSSYAWRIDTLIVSQCRSLFKALKLTDSAQSLDDESDFRAIIAEGSWTERLFAEAGPDTVMPMQTLRILAGVRLKTHEDAANAAMLNPWPNGEPRVYNVPEIHTLFLPTGSAEPKGETLLRMQMTAERNAAKMATGKDVKALAKRFLEARIRIEKANMLGMAQNTAKQADALNALYEYVCSDTPEELVCEFTGLHVDTRRALIDSVINSAQRAVATAESRPREVSFDDFCHLSVESDKLVDQLKAVLASPTYSGGVAAVRVPGPQAPTLADTKAKDLVAHKERVAARLAPKAKTKKLTAKVEPVPTKPPVITSMADLGQVKELLTP
jgi:hypothetical protein